MLAATAHNIKAENRSLDFLSDVDVDNKASFMPLTKELAKYTGAGGSEWVGQAGEEGGGQLGRRTFGKQEEPHGRTL